jgi:hypothetical protein
LRYVVVLAIAKFVHMLTLRENVEHPRKTRKSNNIIDCVFTLSNSGGPPLAPLKEVLGSILSAIVIISA